MVHAPALLGCNAYIPRHGRGAQRFGSV